MGFFLRITVGKGEGSEFHFNQRQVGIGRLPDNDLVLYDAGASRYHCQIVEEDKHYSLRDGGSANGTYLNDALTTEGILNDGDSIRIGSVTFAFRLDDGLFEKVAPKSRRPSEPQSDSIVFKVGTPEERQRLERMATNYSDTPITSDIRAPQLPGERRTPTGSFSALSPLSGLSKSTRLLLVALVCLVVAAAGSALYLSWSAPVLEDQSHKLFMMTERNAGLKFGFGTVDIHAPDRVNFQFFFKGGRATLRYAIGGIESGTEVAILLNNERVAYAPLSPGRWTTELQQRLPREMLREGENILTFNNTRNPGGEERWGVAQVTVDETPLPPQDESKAKQLFELGQATFDTRSVAPQNLARAVEYYDQARLFVEALPEAAQFLTEIDAALERAQKELQNVYESSIFAAEKSLRFGNRQEAEETLRELLRYFPERDDVRHNLIRRRLSEMGADPGR